jgi:5-methylthioribose kinase
MELDIEDFSALRQYLTERKYVQRGEQVEMQKLTGGISNRTIKVSWGNGESWILKQALPKLRVSVDWFSDPQRIDVECRALRWMNRSTPPGTAPSFVFEDMEHYLMGMEAIPDDHQNWKSVLLAGSVNLEHFRQFGRLLGTIHRRSSESPSDCQTFADTTYFENLRLEPYYLYTAQQVGAAEGFLRGLVEETRRRKDCLVHGDFSPKNVLLYRDRLILLDYEVFHFGEPAFDVGFAMAHFLSKAHHVSNRRAEFAKAASEFVDVYRNEIAPVSWATGIESRLVRHSLGCALARVAGKSLLEYMRPEENLRQREVVLRLMMAPPSTIDELISKFITNLEEHVHN